MALLECSALDATNVNVAFELIIKGKCKLREDPLKPLVIFIEFLNVRMLTKYFNVV